MTTDSFGRRVQNIADMTGGISALSRMTEISTRSIKGYIDGDSDPSRMKLIALAEAANVSLEWLATGQGAMRPGESPARSSSPIEDPLIKDIKCWLRDMTMDNPAWRAWFEIELLTKIPAFAEWRKKNQDTRESSAAA